MTEVFFRCIIYIETTRCWVQNYTGIQNIVNVNFPTILANFNRKLFMKCPICYHDDTKVIDSRVATDGLSIRRRRECEECGFRFSTFEEVEILDLSVIKKDGEKETYNRDKIVAGLKRAFAKRPFSDDDFKKLVHGIERDIQQLRKSEINSEEIGEIMMKHLSEVDVVAYIRFASVYKSFENTKDFTDIINRIGVSKRKIRRGVTLRNKKIFDK